MDGATSNSVHTRASLSSFRLRGRATLASPVYMQDVRRWRLSCSLAIRLRGQVREVRLCFSCGDLLTALGEGWNVCTAGHPDLSIYEERSRPDVPHTNYRCGRIALHRSTNR